MVSRVKEAGEVPHLIHAARAFVGAQSEPIEDAILELEGDGTISDVRRATEADRVAPPEQRDDFPTGTALPGFVDAHCHISLPADRRSYEDMARDPDSLMALAAVRNMGRHLAAGVTTIRDNGARNDVTFVVREAVRRGYVLGPRMLLAGRPLTPRGGHFHWCNGVADGVDEIRTRVRELVSQGADHIKIMASGGGTAGLSPFHATYSLDELREAVDTAHMFDRLTTAHCRASESITRALDGGIDCIEHAEFLERVTDVGEADIARPPGVAPNTMMLYSEGIGEHLVASKAYVSFTMQAGGYDTLVEMRERAETSSLPKDEEDLRTQLEAYFEMKLGLFAKLIAVGLRKRLIISTDAGPFDVQFGRLHYGLELAVLGGLTPAEALDAATIVAARACGVDRTTGSLEAHKNADIVIVDGNPLSRISDVSRVLAVYLGGRRIEQAANWVGHGQA